MKCLAESSVHCRRKRYRRPICESYRGSRNRLYTLPGTATQFHSCSGRCDGEAAEARSHPPQLTATEAKNRRATGPQGQVVSANLAQANADTGDQGHLEITASRILAVYRTNVHLRPQRKAVHCHLLTQPLQTGFQR